MVCMLHMAVLYFEDRGVHSCTKSIKSELNEEAKNFVNGCMTISPKN